MTMDPIDLIQRQIDTGAMSQEDAVRVFGSRARKSEILTRKRGLSLRMIRALHDEFGLSASVLIRPYKLTT